ncbi:DNA-binding transcription repressor, partial [Cladochytrium tenue]
MLTSNHDHAADAATTPTTASDTTAAASQDPALTVLLDASPISSRVRDTGAAADAPTPRRALCTAAITAREPNAVLTPRPRRQRQSTIAAASTASAQLSSSPTSRGGGMNRVIENDAGLPATAEAAASPQQPSLHSLPAASVLEVEAGAPPELPLALPFTEKAISDSTAIPVHLAVEFVTSALAPTPRARRAAAAAAINVFAAMKSPKRRTSRAAVATGAAAADLRHAVEPATPAAGPEVVEIGADAARVVSEIETGAPVATPAVLDFTTLGSAESALSSSAVGCADPAPASIPRARRPAAAAAIAANASMSASKRRTSRASFTAVAASQLPSPEPASHSDTVTPSPPTAPVGATTAKTLDSGRRHPAHSTAGCQMGITAAAVNSAVPVLPEIPAASTVEDEVTTFPPARSPWPKRRRTLTRVADDELPISPAVSGGEGTADAVSPQVAMDAVTGDVADLGPPTPSSTNAPIASLMSPSVGGCRGLVRQVGQAYAVEAEANVGPTSGTADAAVYTTAAVNCGLTTKSPRGRRPFLKMPALEHPPLWLWGVDGRPMLDLRLPTAEASLDVLDALLVPNNHTCESTSSRRTSRRLTGADKLREEVLEDEVKHRRARSNSASALQGISDFVEQTQTSAFMEMLAPAVITPRERTLSSKTSRWRRSVCEAAIGGSTALQRFGAPAERVIAILSSFLDASIDGHDCLGREQDQPVKKRRISHIRPGDVAQRAEEEWSVPAKLRELYARKTYLFAGLYSDTFKKEAGSPRIGAKSQLRAFTFSMPIFHGNSMLDTIEDFELPYDLVLGEELRSIDGSSRLDVLAVERKPRNFVKISRNIFVDRRPNNPNNTPVCDCLPDGGGGGGCDESCLNRCMQIECEPPSCPCGPLCSNQAFQRQDVLPAVEVFWAARRGHGLRAKDPVRGGSLIIEYRGEVISTATCLARMRGEYAAEDNFYFLDYGAGEILDACRKGTEARFVNHSCSPNCYIDKWLVRGEHRVGVFALRDIPPGT